MSSVDERIVELKLENGQFERGVRTTVDSLDKLKQGLDFEGSAKGLASVNRAIATTDLSPIASALESIQYRFSTLGVVGMTVISELTKSAMSFFGSIISFAKTSIVTGGLNRALNLEKAQFQLEGLGVAWEAIKDNINDAVSGTAYGLDAAAIVASQLVASGVKYGDATSEMAQALRGISGVASMTSSSYEEIGAIFTTVAGQGKLMTMQLRQLESRGLNVAAELGKQLGKTEAEIREMVTAGKIDFMTFASAMNNAFGEHATKANETYTGSLSNVKAALARIGADVAVKYLEAMTIVFNALRPAINSVHKALQPLLDAIGNRLVAAAQKVGGWIDLFTSNLDSLLEAFGLVTKPAQNAVEEVERVGEAALNTAEAIDEMARLVIRGDYGNGQERREALENLGYSYELVQNRVNELMGDSFRFDVQQQEVLKTEEQLSEANEEVAATTEAMARPFTRVQSIMYSFSVIFRNLWTTMKAVSSIIGGAFVKVFSSFRADGLTRLIESFARLSDTLVLNEGAEGRISKLSVAFEGLFSVFKIGLKAVDAILLGLSYLIDILSGPFNYVIDKVLEYGERIGTVISKAAEEFDSLKLLLGGLAQYITSSEAFATAMTVAKKAFDTFVTVISSKSKTVKSKLETLLKKLLEVVVGWDSASDVIENFKTIASRLFTNLETAIGFVLPVIEKIVSVIKTAYQAVSGFLSNAFQSEGLAGALGKLKEALSEKDLTQIAEAFKGISDVVMSVITEYVIPKIGEAFDLVSEYIGDKLQSFVLPKLDNIGSVIREAVQNAFGENGLSDLLGGLLNIGSTDENTGEVLVTRAVQNTAQAVTNSSTPIQQALDDFQPIVDRLKKIWETLMTFKDKGVFTVIGDFFKGLIGAINPDSIKTLIEILAGGKVIIFLQALTEFIKSITGKPTELGILATGIAEALKTVADSVGGFFKQLSKTMAKVSWVLIATGILEMAIAVAVLAGAIAKLAEIDPHKLAWPLAIILFLIVVLGALAFVLSKTLTPAADKLSKDNPLERISKAFQGFVESFSQGLKIAAIGIVIIGIATAIYLLVKAILLLKDIDIESISAGILIVFGLIVALGLLFIAMGKVGSGVLKTAAGIFIFAASIFLIMEAIKALNAFDWKGNLKGILALVAVIAAFALLEFILDKVLSKDASEKVFKAAAGIALIAAASLLLAASLAILSLLNMEKMAVAALSLGILMLMIGGALGIAAQVGGTNTLKAAAAIVAIAAALLIIDAAIALLTFLPFEDALYSAAMLGVFLAIIFGGIYGIGSLVKEEAIEKLGTAVLKVAGSLLIITLAISILVGMKDLKAAAVSALILIGVLAIIMGGLTLIGKFAGEHAATAAAAVLIVAVSLLGIALVLTTISRINWNEVQEGIVALLAVFGMMSVVLIILSTFGTDALLGAASILIVTAALGILTLALQHLQSLSPEDILVTLLSVTAGIAALCAVAAFAGPPGAVGLIAISAAMIIFSAALGILSLGINAFSDALLKFVTTIPAVMMTFTNIKNGIKSVVEHVGNGIKGLIEFIANGIPEAIRYFIGLIVSFISTMLKMGGALGKAFIEGIGAIFESGFSGLLDGVIGFVEGLGGIASGVADFFISMFDDSASAVESGSSDLNSSLEEAGSSAAESFEFGFSGEDLNVDDLLGDVFPEGSEWDLSSLGESGAFSLGEGFDLGMDGVDFAGALDGTGFNIEEALGGELGDIDYETLGDTFGFNVSDGLGEGLINTNYDQISSALSQGISPEIIAGILGVDVSTIETTFASTMESSLESGAANVDTDTAAQIIMDHFGGSLSGYLHAEAMGTVPGQAIPPNIAAGATSAMPGAIRTIQSAASKGVSGINLSSEAQKVGRGYANALASSSNINAVASAASKLANAAKSGMTGSLVKSGVNMGLGFASGLESSTVLDAVAAAAARVANKAIKTVNATIKSASPSRVAMKQGSFYGLGFAIGIIESSRDVEKASEKLGNSAITSVEQSISQINDLMSSSLNPVISPVLDLTNIQNGINSMDSMLTDSPMSLGNLGFISGLLSDANGYMASQNTSTIYNNHLDFRGTQYNNRPMVERYALDLIESLIYEGGANVGGR